MAGTTIDGLTSSTGAADASRELDKGQSSSRLFYQAVVIEFMSDPDADLEKNPANDPDKTWRESLEKGTNTVKNAALISHIVRNSIIGQIVSDRAAHGGQPQILFPFFSPHLSLPVKAGEQVWVIFPEGAGKGPGYWVTRCISSLSVDDLNYTHKDRETTDIDAQSAENNPEAAMEGETGEEYDPLSFPAGGGRVASNNTMPAQTWPEDVIANSNSYIEQFTPEPVPRFSKRSPDLTLQGSNNTLISLGEDRGRTSETPPEEGTTIVDPEVLGKGTIDLVAGRSVFVTGGKTIFDTDGVIDYSSAENSSSPAAIATNAREKKEIDKTPIATKNNEDGPNVNEGDPNFLNDLSRVYISMKTSGDTNFALEYPATQEIGATSDTPVEAITDDAYVIFKSNQVRVIARKNDDQTINGSIKIIKEGEEDADRAVIMMLPDGTIMIDGPQIIIGSGIEGSPGAGEQVIIGRGATEPLVLGTAMKDLLTAFANECIAMAAGSGTAGNMGGPVLMPALATACSNLIAGLEATLSKVGKTK